MKSVIIYNSQTGFTERYANWIAKELACEAIPFKEAKKQNFDQYDTIIFGSWCMAGSICEIAWFRKLMDQDKSKKYVVFAVGASPIENPEVEVALSKIVLDEHKDICRAFYCPGGLNYGKMKFVSRNLMKMFAKMVANKKDKTDVEKGMAEMIGKDYDISDPKYIEPLVEYLRG